MKSSRQFILLTLSLVLGVSVWAQRPSIPSQPGTEIVKEGETGNSNVDASKTLNYVNSLFDLYNEYDSKLAVDNATNEIIFTDRFSELRGKFREVEFRRTGELMGLYCKSGSECLRATDVDDGSREDDKIKYTFGLKENDKAIPELDRAVDKLNEMLSNLASGSVGSGSSGLSAVAKNNLEIINDAFDKYNSYETVFSVKGTMLHWDSSVANVKADLNNLTFYIDYKSQWMVMRCTDGDCLIGSTSKDSYSMGLSDSNGIAPTIEKVLQAFNDLRREILTN